MEKEDGEMSDDNMLLDEPTEEVSNDTDISTVLYKADKNGLVVQQLEKVDAAKLEERAKRFGLNITGNRAITQKQIDELYQNFGIESENERHFRFDAIYINGVDGLTTREIFEYLEDYKPISLEWVDDISCNVVCQDHISAALALLLHSREINNKEIKDMLAEKSTHHWREGMPHPKKDIIFMRFATNGEKKKILKKTAPSYFDDYYDRSLKSVSKNPWGDLCKSWGVYDHQEILQHKLPKIDYEDDIEVPTQEIKVRNKKLAMRLGKRRLNTHNSSDDSSSDSEWKSKSKTPRMRMHADDEESKQKKRQASKLNTEVTLKPSSREKYAPLSIEVINSRSEYVKREPTRLSDKFKFHGQKKPSNIRLRLGDKVDSEATLQEESSHDSSNESSSENSEHNTMSKVQRVGSKMSSNVWSRLDIERKGSNSHSDLRKILKSRNKQNNHNDLREKLGKSKQTNLRIEIDNNLASD